MIFFALFSVPVSSVNPAIAHAPLAQNPAHNLDLNPVPIFYLLLAHPTTPTPALPFVLTHTTNPAPN